MSGDLYLHIGTEKTGTTSIQRFLKANRELLGRNGILFPTAPGQQNHMALTVAAQEEHVKGPLRRIFKVLTPEEVRKFRDTLNQDMAAELEGQPYRTTIMSGEHCSSRLLSDSEVAWLKDMLSRFFDRIYIVVYIRRQDDYLLSTYSTAIKVGGTRPLAVPSGKRVRLRYDHWELLSRWERVFGREQIICRKFDKSSLKENNVVVDLLDAVHVDQDLPFVQPDSLNESFDANTLEFLRLFNKHVPRFVENELNKTRDNLVALLNAYSSGPLPTLSQEDLHRFMSHFAETNRRVAMEYFGGELHDSDDPLFMPRSDSRDRTSEPDLTVERAVEISAWLWQQKQEEIERLSERIKKQGGTVSERMRRRGGKVGRMSKDRQLVG